jgi:hypothetical protein
MDWNNVPGPFDWAAMLLTVVGFIVAFKQLRKTKNAVSAALEAETDTTQALVTNQLGHLLPELGVIVDRLDYAIKFNDPDDASRSLADYARTAGSSATLINKQVTPDEVLVKRLAQAALKASDAKQVLVLTPHADVRRIVSPIYPELDLVANEAEAAAVSLRFESRKAEKTAEKKTK